MRIAATTLGLFVPIILAGCAEPLREEHTDAEFRALQERDARQSADVFRDAVGRLLARIDREADAGDSTVDFLAMSGGGDYGAFGAGFLIGWAGVEAKEWRRPDFDAVTGVSTGALLAPFAYVGTTEACARVEGFYRDPRADWIAGRGLFFFLPSNSSFMTLYGLERDVRAAVDTPFIERMAQESRSGKLLFISATDLDLGRQKFWDLGYEAERAHAAGAPDRVQQILMASAAIPAVFPPVVIDGSVYADGGVTANVFLRLDPRSPDGILQRWRAEHPGRPLPKVRYWIIVNNQLDQTPHTVQLRWPSVISPSLATAIRSATMAEVRWLAAQADFVNSMWGTDIEVRMVAIPDDWRAPVKGDFKKETMESLADLGRKMGADPASWKVLSSPAEVEAIRKSLQPAQP
jgi:hypothetical protein